MRTYRDIYSLYQKFTNNHTFCGVERKPRLFADVPTAIYSSKTFGIRASCDTEEVDPDPKYVDYNKFIENVKKSPEKLDFKAGLEKILKFEISSDGSFQRRDKTFKFAYLCCYVFDEKTNKRKLVTKYDLYNYEQQSMKDLMEAICDKENVYIWILHCGNEDYEEAHKIKSAREFDDCLAAVITLDFYSTDLFVNGVKQYADKYDVKDGFLKYYFRVVFDKETKEIYVRMYKRDDNSLKSQENGNLTKLVCQYNYDDDYNYYDTNILIGISAICNDQSEFNDRDNFHSVSVDGFIDTLKQNPESYSKLQNDLIKGLEFQSYPTNEAYDANHSVLTSEIGRIEYKYSGYKKSSKITLKNDYFCPLLINPLNIERIYTYTYNIYYGIGFDKEDNLIIDNETRNESLDFEELYDPENTEYIRLLLLDGCKPLEVIKFGLLRFGNKVDSEGNTYYNFGKNKYGPQNTIPCIISKEDGGSFSKMSRKQYEQMIYLPYMEYVFKSVEETMRNHYISLLELPDFLRFDGSRLLYEEKVEEVVEEKLEDNTDEDNTDEDNVDEDNVDEDTTDELETDSLSPNSVSKKRIRISTDKIAFTRPDILMCV